MKIMYDKDGPSEMEADLQNFQGQSYLEILAGIVLIRACF